MEIFKMAGMMRYLPLLVALCATVVRCQMDTSVCMGQDPGPNDPAFPTLPTAFDTHIEANINNRAFTTDFHMWYNLSQNIVGLESTSAGVRLSQIYNFNTSQYLETNRDTNQCTNSPLGTNSPLFTILGTMNGNKPTMRTPNQMLRFNDGGIKTKWVNTTFVRGIKCNMWTSCYYIQATQTTARVDWFFSAPGWTTSYLIPQIPVRAHVYGKAGAKRPFDHVYDFADFHIKPFSGRNHYMTPQGAFCSGEKSLKALPNPTSAFHFTAEIVSPSSYAVTPIKEYYNDELSLGRYDYVPSNARPYGMVPLTEVHDFTTGVAYITDQKRGNCTAIPIEVSMFDVKMADPSHVRIRTSKEFFYFDKAAYIYEGQRVVRGITCDVWIAQRNDWPTAGSGVNTTWEWYFATPTYTETLPDKLQFGNPVMMYMTAGANTGITYYYNIYAYDETRPTIWSYDISKCFNYTSRRDFSFKIPGNYRNLVVGNQEEFRYAVLRAITKAGSDSTHTLSALRVYNIQADYLSGSVISVTFTLLDKAPQIGDTTKQKPENDLNTVASKISAAINGGQFIVKIRDPVTNQPNQMVAQVNSLAQTQRITKVSYYRNTVPGTTTSTGSSGGVMAGLGVAMLVVFFILGVLGTYFYYRRQGGAFGPKRFDNQDITESTS
ncbi:uncharacterized protein LOC128221721 [Mya arenaria]|uniref:uncharacterized protein LOC128221721 n=1 Tax=Mya arenaria TaxID=6604 RepID=UPI0022E73127|nr:uncharacterized protein LOC128221721 [Mya arenaria]